MENVDAVEVEKVQNDGAGAGECPGVITALAVLPKKTILNEAAMAKIFDVTDRTIRRMVTRHEIPPPIRVAGRSSWFAGYVLDHLDAQAVKKQKEAERVMSKIRRISP